MGKVRMARPKRKAGGKSAARTNLPPIEAPNASPAKAQTVLAKTPPLDRLLAVMAALRHPAKGCPWDLEQDFHTIAPHTIEEAYEVVETIEAGDLGALKDELGDLLFQVVFYAQLAKERGLYDFNVIAAAIADKMIRRHPNVFADRKVADAKAQTEAWEDGKARERGAASALDGVARTLPALTRAAKLQKRAARIGFDWPKAEPVLTKIAEEVVELEQAMKRGRQRAVAEEMGDLLFTCVNLARKLDLDPETVLRRANRKFERRFRAVEKSGARTLETMEAAWEKAKGAEKRRRKRP
jgi:ATP diphosphatase